MSLVLLYGNPELPAIAVEREVTDDQGNTRVTHDLHLLAVTETREDVPDDEFIAVGEKVPADDADGGDDAIEPSAPVTVTQPGTPPVGAPTGGAPFAPPPAPPPAPQV